jgi:hypothetical protein
VDAPTTWRQPTAERIEELAREIETALRAAEGRKPLDGSRTLAEEASA